MITQVEILRYLNIAIKVWATTTVYKIGNYVSKDGTIYECLLDHTSGTFATDLTNLNWSASTFMLSCVEQAVSDVNTFCNRDFRAAAYTQYFTGSNSSRAMVRNFPVNSVTSLKILDTDTNAYTDNVIDGSADTIANTLILDRYAIELLKGYSFSEGSRYQLVYNGGYVSSAIWVTLAVYEVGNYVVNNSNKYVCLVAHTAGTFATDLAAAKWELSTSESVPGAVKQVTLEKAAWYYKSSYNGGGRLGLNSENTGGQSSDGKSFDNEGMNQRHEKILQRFRIQNI